MIELAIAVCTPVPTVTVKEGSATVTATYIPLTSDGDGGRIGTISLKRPLGERVAIAGSTGATIAMLPATVELNP